MSSILVEDTTAVRQPAYKPSIPAYRLYRHAYKLHIYGVEKNGKKGKTKKRKHHALKRN